MARLVCWGGTLPQEIQPSEVAGPVAGEPLHFVVGDRDKWVAQEAVVADAARMREGGCPAVVHHFVGGHRVDDGVLRSLERAET